jgi:hypothetical protein
MAVGDIYQVSNDFMYQGSPNSYITHLRVDAEGAPDLVTLQLANFGVAQEMAFLPLHNPSVNFDCVTVRQIFPTSALPKQLVTGSTGQRTCSPLLDHLPGQCSAVVTLYGDVADPTANNRGRDYWTGQCCSDQIDGVWNNVGGYLEELCMFYQVRGNTVLAGANSFSIGIFSPTRAGFRTGPNVPPDPPFFWQLVFVRGRSLVRTQRRRQPQARCEETCEAVVGAPQPP